VFSILIADNDENDRLLAQLALKECCLFNPVFFVADGVQAMDFLYKRGIYADALSPGLVLLDLNMPRQDGRQVLAEMKANPVLKAIPVIIMTGSETEIDREASYRLGVMGYLIKPLTFTSLEAVIKTIPQLGFRIVEA